MQSLQDLKLKAAPLIGATILDADLWIFPTDISGDILQTDTMLFLKSSAGNFVFGLSSDGQHPNVELLENFSIFTINKQYDFNERLFKWKKDNNATFVNHESFNIDEFPKFIDVKGNVIREILIYKYTENGLTGIKLVLDRISIYSVPGANGNLILSELPDDYFLEEVEEHPV